LEKVFEFIYKVRFENGLTENEVDHVFAGKYNNDIKFNPAEVQNICFKSLQEIKESVRSNPHSYTEWFLLAFPKIENWRNQLAIDNRQ